LDNADANFSEQQDLRVWEEAGTSNPLFRTLEGVRSSEDKGIKSEVGTARPGQARPVTVWHSVSSLAQRD